MAILGGVVTSAPVQGVSVSGPADENPPTGAGIMGLNGKWVIDPGESFVIQAFGTLGISAGVNLDWTQAGYFSFTLAASGTTAITFGTGSATGVNSPTAGQFIKVRLIGGGGGNVTWPATINWLGLTAAPVVAVVAPIVTGSVPIDISLVCTLGGSAPTFDGTYITG
jgi:hypothetical protein